MIELLVQYVLSNPQAGVLTTMGVYLVYEIRCGRIADLSMSVETLSSRLDGAFVILYRLARESDETNAQAVRDVLWNNGRSFPDDFDAEGRYTGDRTPGSHEDRQYTDGGEDQH